MILECRCLLRYFQIEVTRHFDPSQPFGHQTAMAMKVPVCHQHMLCWWHRSKNRQLPPLKVTIRRLRRG